MFSDICALDVEYVRLGGTGLEVSHLCLGTWMFGTETDDGVNFVVASKVYFDT